jgi:hypothetical protein
MFQTLTGPDSFQIIDGEGAPQQIASPDELSIGSMELRLRRAPAPASGSSPQHQTHVVNTFSDAAATRGLDRGQASNQASRSTGPAGAAESVVSAPADYHRYRLEIPNRSMASADARRTVANLLQEVLDLVDPEIGGDIQLLDLQLTFTAAPAAVEKVESTAEAANADWDEETLDF